MFKIFDIYEIFVFEIEIREILNSEIDMVNDYFLIFIWIGRYLNFNFEW